MKESLNTLSSFIPLIVIFIIIYVLIIRPRQNKAIKNTDRSHNKAKDIEKVLKEYEKNLGTLISLKNTKTAKEFFEGKEVGFIESGKLVSLYVFKENIKEHISGGTKLDWLLSEQLELRNGIWNDEAKVIEKLRSTESYDTLLYITNLFNRYAKNAKKVISLQIDLLKHVDWRVRTSATEVLGAMGGLYWEICKRKGLSSVDHLLSLLRPLIAALKKSALEPLIITLKDENWNVRLSAVGALGDIKDRHTVEPLIVALKDENAHVRKNAKWALENITGITITETSSYFSEERFLTKWEQMKNKGWVNDDLIDFEIANQESSSPDQL